ncbi:hypothetical protein PUNSTDRAFT_138391 [Punctularia strigosozonata HHB-11173 SS5]|uniref:C2H2-type domain-containing protein n=1 Tax=Punctularia strigosozonata (strain HHB-11173) TaxID=741275 RepID=R7S5M9_PUNST|nr:uncharacterized protein PUNSTDRAFT_138391 [Punctularia strigosozonata HHB-11173 SS5]EIN04746.1 hypothetical protein PUNSTDRAFT_138391 [Punctularia strigosozonata HHB-11173 SS5]
MHSTQECDWEAVIQSILSSSTNPGLDDEPKGQGVFTTFEHIPSDSTAPGRTPTFDAGLEYTPDQFSLPPSPQSHMAVAPSSWEGSMSRPVFSTASQPSMLHPTAFVNRAASVPNMSPQLQTPAFGSRTVSMPSVPSTARFYPQEAEASYPCQAVPIPQVPSAHNAPPRGQVYNSATSRPQHLPFASLPHTQQSGMPFTGYVSTSGTQNETFTDMTNQPPFASSNRAHGAHPMMMRDFLAQGYANLPPPEAAYPGFDSHIPTQAPTFFPGEQVSTGSRLPAHWNRQYSGAPDAHHRYIAPSMAHPFYDPARNAAISHRQNHRQPPFTASYSQQASASSQQFFVTGGTATTSTFPPFVNEIGPRHAQAALDLQQPRQPALPPALAAPDQPHALADAASDIANFNSSSESLAGPSRTSRHPRRTTKPRQSETARPRRNVAKAPVRRRGSKPYDTVESGGRTTCRWPRCENNEVPTKHLISHLSDHISERNLAEGRRSFHCPFCDHTSGTRKELLRHLVSEKHGMCVKFMCECGRSFSRADARTRHRKSKTHKEIMAELDPTYECDTQDEADDDEFP